MSTAQISSPTAQNTPSTPTSQGSLEKAVKFEPPCMSQDEFKAKLALAGQCAIAQATFILGIAAPGRDESLSDSNYAACEQAAHVEVSWLGNNGNKPCKDAMIKAFKSASRLILNEATGLMKVTLRQMSAEAHDAVMAMLNTAFSVNVEVFSLRVPHFVFVIPKSEHNIVLFSQSVKALAESATLHVWSWIDLKASGRYTGRQYGQRFRDNCVIGIAGPDAPKVVDAVAAMTHAAANSIGAFSRSIKPAVSASSFSERSGVAHGVCGVWQRFGKPHPSGHCVGSNLGSVAASPPPPPPTATAIAFSQQLRRGDRSGTDKDSGLAELGKALRHRVACAQPADRREVSNTVSFLELAPLGRPRPRRSTPALEQPESNPPSPSALRASGWSEPLG